MRLVSLGSPRASFLIAPRLSYRSFSLAVSRNSTSRAMPGRRVAVPATIPAPRAKALRLAPADRRATRAPRSGSARIPRDLGRPRRPPADIRRAWCRDETIDAHALIDAHQQWPKRALTLAPRRAGSSSRSTSSGPKNAEPNPPGYPGPHHDADYPPRMQATQIGITTARKAVVTAR